MDKLWENMYTLDHYARERVIKSVRLLYPYLKDGDTVLDVGCFTQLARFLLPSSVKYIGVDSVDYSGNSLVVELDNPISILPNFQHVLCLETLEHLVSPKNTCQKIHTGLSHTGYLVVSLPNEATLFHRIRCMFGIVDGDCFQGQGKHLHLPSLAQSRLFLSQYFQIVRGEYYISPSACGSKQAWVGRILQLIPDALHQFLADHLPSLFARGFIFLLKPKPQSKAQVPA